MIRQRGHCAAAASPEVKLPRKVRETRLGTSQTPGKAFFPVKGSEEAIFADAVVAEMVTSLFGRSSPHGAWT